MTGKNLTLILSLLLLFGSGCEKYYVTIKKEPIDRQYLASTFVGSPDPLQITPPLGQILFVEWSISSENLKKNPHLVLEIIYGDWSEQKLVFDIDKRRGIIQYDLQGAPYKKKEGLFSYRALIQTPSGEVLQQWSQLMWTPLVDTSQ
ncbi:hypothetical protein COB21_01115 [Candidatus Aerophobetes bacterium]|uniref:Lipoprotein n=1 Tax=Aerophobetes bacterium TaxID=2030807 RepID=A0A2A4X812_UNCAE|nr:MAG: hypothetical protein COB21_01115 [Candidatus Aerophobetes bacterium]